MIINKSLNLMQFDPYIKTEETICKLLERDKGGISDDYTLMFMPLTHIINELGVRAANQIINHKKGVVKNSRRVFVCQHIFVNQLNFRDSDIVFTPHSTIEDNFYTIPHYAVNFNKPILEKKEGFSFLGSTTTHWTRKKITEVYDNCYDSGTHWGLDNNLSDDFKQKYIDHTNKFKYALCPRGTGISSVRLFEAMAMNCTPIIIADNYKLPLDNIINWDNYIIRVPERDVLKIENYLEPKNNILEIYNKYFSNNNLHETIKHTLK